MLAVRVANAAEKEAVLSMAGPFFTEPRYNGYPAVLIRLALIDDDLLERLLLDGWRCQAPKALVKAIGA